MMISYKSFYYNFLLVCNNNKNYYSLSQQTIKLFTRTRQLVCLFNKKLSIYIFYEAHCK